MTQFVTIDLDKLRADIAQKRRELAELESLEKTAVTYAISGTPTTNPSQGQDEIRVVDNDSVAEIDVCDKPVYEAAEVVLHKAGKPLKTRAIVDALTAAKYPFGSSNVHNAVFTAMARKPERFQKPAPGVWDLIRKHITEVSSKDQNGNGSHSN